LHSSEPTISEKLKNSHLIGVLFYKKLSKILLRFYPPTIREISENSLIVGFFPLGKISTESTNYKGGLMNYETPPDLGRPHRHTRYSLRQKSG
jgi:hypothetical protein